MKTPLTRSETSLVVALILAIALACLGPAVAQYADYHAFADQRTLWGLPFAMDVLSNAPFALLGAWGLLRLQSMRTPPARRTGFVALVPCDAQRPLAQLFFGGLVLTALCSGYYHLQPNDVGLAIDRMGMLVAFAGLLGLAAPLIGALIGPLVALPGLVLAGSPLHLAQGLGWFTAVG